MENNFLSIKAQQGWQCPICGKVLAPWMCECPCRGNPQYTTTTTSITIDGIPAEDYGRLDKTKINFD